MCLEKKRMKLFAFTFIFCSRNLVGKIIINTININTRGNSKYNTRSTR